ncbi:hypothetical protein [Cupriavidus pauculus]|jgi:hypothetical protein|uniref:hypothetical protein n=1 Tax=Cupriavidus pauculus TaxID=82633 RepID=UPI0038573558
MLRKVVQDDLSFQEDFEAAGRDWAPRLKPCGTCHACEQPVGKTDLFCGIACQYAFEHFEMQLLKKR